MKTTSSPVNCPFSDRVAIASLLAITLLVRASVLWTMQDNLKQDPDAYREIAENLLRHGVIGLGNSDSPVPTAFRPPLYPVLLSGAAASGAAISGVKVAALHLLLGLGTVLLTYFTARRMQVTRLGAVLAGLIVACDPILLNQQTLVMTETLATFLAILALWTLSRLNGRQHWSSAALAGCTVGLAILCRPVFLPWLGLVAMAMLLTRWIGATDDTQMSTDPKGTLKRRLSDVVAMVIAAAVIVSPWVIRNQIVFGKPIATTTHGGYTLWLGNNESFYRHLARDTSGLPWEVSSTRTPLDNRSPMSELQADAVHKSAAWKTIRANPALFFRACLFRIWQLWSPLPNPLTAKESLARRLLRYATAAWYGGVYLLAAVGAWKLRRRLRSAPWIWGVVLCLTFTAVHSIYWSNLRMRAPLMPFVALVASAGIGLASSSKL